MLLGTLLAFLAVAGPEAPSPVPTPVSSKPRSLADVARENKARGEKKAGTFSVAGGGEVAPVPEEPAARTGSGRPRSTPNPSPASGTDEAHWRERAQRLRDELESARRDEAEADARLQAAFTKAHNSEEMLKIAEEIRKQARVCRLRAESARQRLEALPEEARQAGANPGWVR
ncbi:MAG TPA: hypothetical protein VL084_04725 [Thermoanaerobaculia bacterium]|nr:hypothetical protein [Thermoanaerobaculia bacterium]